MNDMPDDSKSKFGKDKKPKWRTFKNITDHRPFVDMSGHDLPGLYLSVQSANVEHASLNECIEWTAKTNELLTFANKTKDVILSRYVQRLQMRIDARYKQFKSA